MTTIMLGVTPPGGGTPTNLISGALAFETDANKNVAIINYYEQMDPSQPWGSGNTAYLTAISGHHTAIPMMTWQPSPWSDETKTSGSSYTLAAIADGTYDTIIKSYADGIKGYGGLVLLRFAHEMNGTWYAWGIGNNGNTAQDYINAWQHVHALFATEGANNVLWVWCPNINSGSIPFATMYPGDAYVDYLGLDGYNWGGLNSTSWQTFDQVFDQNSSYADLLAISSKPVILAEFACNEPYPTPDGGTQKGNWFTNAFGTAIPARTNLAAVIYFNATVSGANWPIESTTTATADFKSAVSSSTYVSSWLMNNQVVNGSFGTNWYDPWLFTPSGGTAVGTLNQDTGPDSNKCARIDISSADATHQWNVQLYQESFSYQMGRLVTITFKAKATNNNVIGVAISGTNFYQSLISLTSTWTEYSYSYTPTADGTGILEFNFAQDTGSIYLSEVTCSQ